MYLKFIKKDGSIIRYYEIKKRIIISQVKNCSNFTAQRFYVSVDKRKIDITEDIKLLYDILSNDFKCDIYKFESIYNIAQFYVSNIQLLHKNLLVVFGSTFIDLTTRQFYSMPVINGNVILQNVKQVEIPYYYKA